MTRNAESRRGRGLNPPPFLIDEPYPFLWLGGILHGAAGLLRGLSRAFAEMFAGAIHVLAKMLAAPRDSTALHVRAQTLAGLFHLFTALLHLTLDGCVAVFVGLLSERE